MRAAEFVEKLRVPDGGHPRPTGYGHNPDPFHYPDLSNDVASGGWRDMSDDEMGDAVAWVGWFTLIDQSPSASDPAHWGLLTHDLPRKPAADAFAAAPSERHRPKVRMRRSISRRLARRGLRVRVRPRSRGTVVAELRRNERVLVRASEWCRQAGQAAAPSAEARAAGATVRRTLRVR